MKQGILTGILIFYVFVFPCQSNDWNRVVSQVNQDIEATEADIRTTQARIAAERKQLTGELAGLEQDVRDTEAVLANLKQEFETLLKSESELLQETQAVEGDRKVIENIIRTSAKDVNDFLKKSPVSAEHPEHHERIEPILDPERFPGMDDVRHIFEVLWMHCEASTEIRQSKSEFINSEGETETGDIIRIGNIQAIYRNEKNVGFLRKDNNFNSLIAIPGTPPWSVRKTIEAYFAGKSDVLPVDISGGIIVEQLNRKSNLRDWLDAGGILVFPIIGIGVVALILILERVITLFSIPVNTDRIMDQFKSWYEQNDQHAIDAFLKKHQQIPIGRLAFTAIKYQDADPSLFETAMDEAALREIPRLERFLMTLSVLAAIAPLLGLLGTVTGMIHTFEGITLFGTGNPRLMSGGISEALITTQLGLTVAIPIMIAHHLLDRRVEKIIGDMEEKSTALAILTKQVSK